MKRGKGDHLLTEEVCVRLPEDAQDFLLSAIRLGDIQVMQGNLREAAHTFWQLLRDAAEEVSWHSMTAHLRLCDIHREWNDLARAVDHWQQAMLLVERSGQGGFAPVEFSLLAARLAWARGEREEVMVWLEEAEESSRYFGENDTYLAQITAYRVQFSLSQGDLVSASRWGEQDILAEEAMNLNGCYLMRARLGIAQRRPEEAIGLLENTLQVIQSQGRVGSEIAILILLAQAYHAQGKRLQALRMLERAITLAEPGGYIRVFVDEGPVMARLFTEYYNRIQQRTLREQQAFPLAYIRTVLAAFGRAAQPAIWSIPQKGEDVLIEKLSEREQEVLALIAAGLSNQEIAQRLVVTVSTVKTHLNNIYAKLHVHTRLQAVTRAHDAGMLRRSDEPVARSKTTARAR
jgi:LuxR family maltose regulon positive regulatory protein